MSAYGRAWVEHESPQRWRHDSGGRLWRQENGTLKCWFRAALRINSEPRALVLSAPGSELCTWMSSDVKCPFMSLFFFLGGGGAGLWAGGRSVLLRQWKDNMTLSTVRVGHSLAPSPSTPLYYEKSCLHLPFFSLFPWNLIDLPSGAL